VDSKEGKEKQKQFLWLRHCNLVLKGRQCQMLTIRDVTKLIQVEKVETEN
jgi:hypothetical protein